jgi:hypothetical protein
MPVGMGSWQPNIKLDLLIIIVGALVNRWCKNCEILTTSQSNGKQKLQNEAWKNVLI